MKKHGLFLKTFSAILAVLLVTVLLTTVMLLNNQRKNIQERYETEVRMQARQVSELLQQMNRLSLLRNNSTIRYLVKEKISQIYNDYNADIWLVNFVSGRVEYIDNTLNTSEYITDEAVLDELAMIQDGCEITREGLFSDRLGKSIVTIGVPWTYAYGDEQTVVGAVLLHIPREELQVSLTSILPMAVLPFCVSLVLAVVLSLVLARSQTHPIHVIENAVRRFATGDLSERIGLDCGGELEELADSINNMARDLDDLERSRKDFVANVSHELRSPLTSMKGYIQAINDGVIPVEEQSKYLGIVLDETNRLTALVNDLLDLSRLESGRFPMEIAPFDANELMRRVLIRYAQRIDEKNIDVHVDLTDDPCFAAGDVSRITQVLSNLVDNAVKFLDRDGSILTLSITREGDRVRFSVQDNGPGISAQDLPRIQERFYKVDKAHTSGTGTGLGLSICKTILAQHDTCLEIESQPGIRTVFSFTLRYTKPAMRIAQPASASDMPV